VYAIVWPLLYTLVGVAAALLWLEARWCAALVLVAVALGTTTAWSWLFVAFEARLAASISIVVSLGVAAVAAATAWGVSIAAGALLLLLPVWLAFASVLSWWTWSLNRAGYAPPGEKRAEHVLKSSDANSNRWGF
jgi:benzodiazapine receptor